MKKIIGYIACLLTGVLAFSACQNDVFENIPSEDNGDMVYFGMNLPEAEDIVVTRAEASEMEKEIHTVHILAFDKNEKCFYNKEVYNDSEGSYASTRILAIPKQSGEDYTQCTVYAISNVGTDEEVAKGSYDFTEVKNLDDLKATYGYRFLQGNNSNDLTKRTCIPMTGYVENIDMTHSTSIGNPYKIELERVLARVTFSVSVTNSDLEFYFNNWTVGSLPRYSYVIPQDVDMTSKPEGVTYEPYFPSNETEENLTTYGVGQWIRPDDTDNQTYGFYMYENRKGGRLQSPNPDNLYGEPGDYANEIKNQTDGTGTDPKYKTLYAPANASFIILTGVIRDKNTQNVNSFAYKIALGANNATDYNILRNHNYVYNIKINGLKYDDITVDAFDSRVHKAYALQISAPYSQQMDAHYDKRYLDILASPGDLELQFYLTQADAEAGKNPITGKDWIVLSEMDTYNIDIDKNESTKKEYTFNDVEHKKYFIYTQENLTTEARSVVLRVKHTPTPESSEVVNNPVYRYYTYTQAGVIEINGLYVESYEEYGMNLDPYSPEQAVQGLQWGGTADIDAYDKQNGYSNTSQILNTLGHSNYLKNAEMLYKDYAAGYCYNKNKRNADGSISPENYKWYMPAIDQLITLTDEVKGSIQGNAGNGTAWTPTSMAGNIYWSSSVPTEQEVTRNPFEGDWGIFLDWLRKILYAIWEAFFRSRVENPNGEYYYTKVAKSVMDGNEKFDPAGGTEQGYEISSYYRRFETMKVRAVRVKE